MTSSAPTPTTTCGRPRSRSSQTARRGSAGCSGSLPPGADELSPLLTIQYLIQSRYGAVAYAYATTRPGMIFGGGGRGLFRMITESGYIGERPQTY